LLSFLYLLYIYICVKERAKAHETLILRTQHTKFAANLSFFFLSSKEFSAFLSENADFLLFLSLFYYLCVRIGIKMSNKTR